MLTLVTRSRTEVPQKSVVAIGINDCTRPYSNGQENPNWIVGNIKSAVDFMNVGTLQKIFLLVESD